MFLEDVPAQIEGQIPELTETNVSIPVLNSDQERIAEFHNYHKPAFIETENLVPATVQQSVEVFCDDNDEGCLNCRSRIQEFKAEIALLKAKLETVKQENCEILYSI